MGLEGCSCVAVGCMVLTVVVVVVMLVVVRVQEVLVLVRRVVLIAIVTWLSGAAAAAARFSALCVANIIFLLLHLSEVRFYLAVAKLKRLVKQLEMCVRKAQLLGNTRNFGILGDSEKSG